MNWNRLIVAVLLSSVATCFIQCEEHVESSQDASVQLTANGDKPSCCQAKENKSCCKDKENKPCCKDKENKSCCKDKEDKSCCKDKQDKSCCAITDKAIAELGTSAAAGGDWLGWRGPNGNGIAAEGQTPPIKWSDTENVIWMSTILGRGHSSPVIIGDQVILTTAIDEDQEQIVLSHSRTTGEEIWSTVVNTGGFPKEIHKKNTHASPTVATNGELIFAVFNNNDGVQLSALDMQGKIVWQKKAGGYDPKYKFGYAPSPTLHGTTVIVASDYDANGYIAAFDQKTGEEIWRTARPSQTSYSSPIVANVAGRDQLLLTGALKMSSYDPKSGELLWDAEGISKATCGTVVWDSGIVVGSGGYPESKTMAVKADGSGEILWVNNTKSYEQSMLAFDGHVYAVDDRSVAHCWDIQTGEEKWSETLGRRSPVSSSPTLANGHIYAANEKGTTYVFKASPDKFELVATNQLGDESFATPTIVGGRIYTRVALGGGSGRVEYLYCIGTSESE